jgi:flagellar biogenesis protein FliO
MMESSPAFESRGWLGSALTSLWRRVRATTASVSVHRRHRRLRLCETLSLGEKRIVAVVQFDEQRFLIAATPQNISLLQSLGSAPAEEDHPASQ